MKTAQENILIVDDTLENLHLLTRQGYKVRPAPSGQLALSGAQAITPDLILLDINMPQMDGYEVCLRLKQVVWIILQNHFRLKKYWPG